jgi:hypothetical protein
MIELYLTMRMYNLPSIQIFFNDNIKERIGSNKSVSGGFSIGKTYRFHEQKSYWKKNFNTGSVRM